MTRLNGFNLGGSSHLQPPASVPAPASGSGLRPAGSSAAAQGKQQERAIQGRGGARVSPLAPAPGTSAAGPQQTAASAATGGRSAAGGAPSTAPCSSDQCSTSALQFKQASSPASKVR